MDYSGGSILDEKYHPVENNDVQSDGKSIVDIVIIVIVVVLIIVLLYMLWNYISGGFCGDVDPDDYLRLGGEHKDRAAIDLVRKYEGANLSPVGHMRLGTTYYLNMKDKQRAFDHFRMAIKGAEEKKQDVEYIAGRIQDIIRTGEQPVDEMDEEIDIEIQQALLRDYEDRKRDLEQIRGVMGAGDPPINEEVKGLAAEIAEAKSGDNRYTEKVILSKTKWHSDTQNVHDSTLYQELVQQYDIVKEENKKIPNIQLKDYKGMCQWVRARLGGREMDLHRANKVLEVWDNNYPIQAMGGSVSEQDLIMAVWHRIHDPQNAERMNALKEAFVEGILDCLENDHVVCMSGRNSKIWQILGSIDHNEQMGILRTKETIKNTIILKCASIVNKYMTSGVVPENVLEDYKSGAVTNEVSELKETIIKEIKELRDEYNGKLPQEQLDILIEECVSVI